MTPNGKVNLTDKFEALASIVLDENEEKLLDLELKETNLGRKVNRIQDNSWDPMATDTITWWQFEKEDSECYLRRRTYEEHWLDDSYHQH